ncbi:hypothetical protein K439DRAFT_1329550 [Ramaria rubella]|nr:hypothetical protein K439DRAFT_1329550 [Ramaria rubella]
MDVSRSSASSLDPALSTLSLKDAEVLDAIIAKVPNATAFMTVFKAYSEVLQDRRLDPGNDVVYYKQLLKLGVIKGANWGIKWNIVKSHLDLDLSNVTTQHPGKRVPSKILHPQHEDDVFTLHSHADTETAVDLLCRSGLQPGRPLETVLSSTTVPIESIETHSEVSRSSTPIRISPPACQLSALRGRFTPLASSRSSMNESPVRSSTPPLPRFRRNRSPPALLMARNEARSLQKPTIGRLNDVEAWKKVEQARQLQDADRFRRETLISMCFHTWKGGLDWIRTTHSQIVSARNQIQLQVFLSRWRKQVVELQQTDERAAAVARFRNHSATFGLWKEQTHRKRTLAWRAKMRNLMVHLKRKGDERMRNDSWTKWRQLYLSRQLHAHNLLLRTFYRWRITLQKIDALVTLADEFGIMRERQTIGNVMEFWSRRIQMRDAEKYLDQRVSRRILMTTFEGWMHNLEDNHRAAVYQTAALTKRTFESWRRVKTHKRMLNSRGDKYVKRRNNLLLRAIIRVWVARERGQLLDRVRSTRLLRDAFFVWHERIQQQQVLQDRAITFSQQPSGSLLVSTMSTWARRRNLLLNNSIFSRRHFDSNLLYRTLLIWRLHLRARLKQTRKAKLARKYFIEKWAWNRWLLVLGKIIRNRKIKLLEHAKLTHLFRSWKVVVRRRKHEDQVFKTWQKRKRRHLLRDAVQHWTDRVVLIKLRELDAVEQRDREILSVALTKWKDTSLRHVENLSLANSFQDVKREDTLRRMFIKWLAAARKSNTCRTRLAEREHELRLETLAAAWEAWRDHFREIGLRDLAGHSLYPVYSILIALPQEYQVIIQSQNNILCRAFGVWRSKSKSVPGIRLYATNLKFKMWVIWRTAIPIAIQIRRAREVYLRRILSAMFERWKEARRAKIALKAVARARYLRLPSPGYRAPTSVPQSQESSLLRPLLHRPLRSLVSAPMNDAPNPVHISSSSGHGPETRWRGYSSLLASRPASRAATAGESPHIRAVGSGNQVGDDRRDALWNALRGTTMYDSPYTYKTPSR